jgi:hypothetical protein
LPGDIVHRVLGPRPSTSRRAAISPARRASTSTRSGVAPRPSSRARGCSS